MERMQVLVVGEVAQAEFAAAARSLAEVARPVACATPDEAHAWLAEGHPADLIVLAQRWPGEFTPAQVDRLRRTAPLVPLWSLLGSWCEGETRSGRPWPAVVRAYWHQWAARFERDHARFASGRCPTWGMPATSTDEERLLASEPPPAADSAELVLVCSPSQHAADWLMDVCRRAGRQAAWVRYETAQAGLPPRMAGAVAALLDGHDAGAGELAATRALRHALADAPILALLDFPRWQNVDRLVEAGASEVLGKPLAVDDLQWRLGQLISVNPTRSDRSTPSE